MIFTYNHDSPNKKRSKDSVRRASKLATPQPNSKQSWMISTYIKAVLPSCNRSGPVTESPITSSSPSVSSSSPRSAPSRSDPLGSALSRSDRYTAYSSPSDFTSSSDSPFERNANSSDKPLSHESFIPLCSNKIQPPSPNNSSKDII
eukprot:Platyproteum_vivax@DN7971_c0_g1_i1.p1